MQCKKIVVVQLLSHAQLFVTPWTAACQVSPFFTLKLMSIESMVCSNSCPLSRWCHPTISSSVAPFSSCPQSFPASGSFPLVWIWPVCKFPGGAEQNDAINQLGCWRRWPYRNGGPEGKAQKGKLANHLHLFTSLGKPGIWLGPVQSTELWVDDCNCVPMTIETGIIDTSF